MFANNAYMKVWEIKQGASGNYYEVDMSSQRKNQDGDYVKDFSSKFVRFVGKAKEKISSIDAGSVIQIKSCGVENFYNTEKKREYTTFKVFDFDPVDTANKKNSGSASKAETKKTDSVDAYDDDLPF